ncbi:MAG: PAS domain S-box protein, partial [Candidatus Bathyarchaeota archaeon]
MARSTVESTVPVAFDFAEKASIHVLHVDDEVSLLKVSQSCLEMEGSLRVDVAASVEEALRRMEKKTFDAIISDYVMPGKDGLEFLKELRDNGSNIPFIIFTGKGREEVAIRALNLGADQYLSKAGAPETVYRELAHSITQAVKRRRAEEELRKSEERYRNLFELAPDGIVTLDTKGVVTSCNATVRKLTGYTKDEIIGKHFSRLGFLQAGDIPKYLKRFTSIVGGDLPKPFEAGWKGRDGSSSISEFHVSLVKTNGKTEGVQVVARDITERRKAEELYKNIVELSPESIITINKKGMITSCNVTATKMLGYSKEEMIGKHFSKIGVIRARDLPSFLKLFLSVLREEVNEPLELTFQTKTGTTLRAEVRVGLLRENGKVVGIQAISQDITQRKKVESEIRDSQEKFQKLFIHNPEASVYVNVDYKIVDVNPRFINLFGYHLDEIKGKYIDEVVVPEDRTEEGKMLCQKA